MTKEEVGKLSEELWELSEFEEQNKERMKEIAHVLVTYYMWWTDVENADIRYQKEDSDVSTVSNM